MMTSTSGIETSEESESSDAEDLCGSQQGWLDPTDGAHLSYQSWEPSWTHSHTLPHLPRLASSSTICQRSVTLALALASCRRQVCGFTCTFSICITVSVPHFSFVNMALIFMLFFLYTLHWLIMSCLWGWAQVSASRTRSEMRAKEVARRGGLTRLLVETARTHPRLTAAACCLYRTSQAHQESPKLKSRCVFKCPVALERDGGVEILFSPSGVFVAL